MAADDTTDYVVQGKRITYERGRAFPPSQATLDLAATMRVSAGEVVCDVCCGGGLLSIAASLFGAAKVFATDIDEPSLRMAMFNAASNEVSNIEFLLGDCMERVSVPVDVVVANPPQLPQFLSDQFSESVRRWIEGGGDGADFSTRLIKEAHAGLTPSGRLYLPVFSLANPMRTRVLLDRYFLCSRVSSRAVLLDKRHGLDVIENLRDFERAGLLELALVDGLPAWTIEIYEGVRRDQPLS
jgi:methylase of polypeptide subunit release factors